MASRLVEFRRAMRWSQEALAAELSVSVSTISRWERAAAAEVRNPFANFLRATVTRSSHRLALYARAMLPSDYLKEVRRSNSERTVYVGPEAVIVEMSDGVRLNWGMMRYCGGMSIAPFLPAAERELIAKHHAEIGQVVQNLDVSKEIVFVTHGGPPGTTWPWRRHVQHSPFPYIIEMNSTPISKEDFEATSHKLLIRTR